MKDIVAAQLPLDETSEANERSLSYTDRVPSLVVKTWPQEKLPYAQLSAVAHAQLVGLERNLTRGEPLFAASCPATTAWGCGRTPIWSSER